MLSLSKNSSFIDNLRSFEERMPYVAREDVSDWCGRRITKIQIGVRVPLAIFDLRTLKKVRTKSWIFSPAESNQVEVRSVRSMMAGNLGKHKVGNRMVIE